MDEDITNQRDAIIDATLMHIAFEGMTEKALIHGIEDAGYDEDMLYRAFPDDMRDVILHWADRGDRRMQAIMAARDDLAELNDEQRIAAAVRARLEVDAADRHSVRRISSYLALPTNAPMAARLTARTVNALWYAAGDTATNFSYYTKRAMLTAVYSAVVLYWLNDESEDSAETWDFLDRTLNKAMKFGRLPRRLPSPKLFRPPNPFAVLSAPITGLRDRLVNRFG